MKVKISCLLGFSLWICTCVAGQIDAYHFNRPITDINEQWHQIILPTTIYEKVNPNLSDIRIYGITPAKDTIEAPYLLKTVTPQIEKEGRNFQLINTSNNSNGHYFTFELPTENAINEIQLDFLQNNYDWTVQLEGSQNQNEWFELVDNYRLVAITNESTDYEFSTIHFPAAKYRYLRVLVKTDQVVALRKATLNLQTTMAAKYEDYAIVNQAIKSDNQRKTTVIDLTLKHQLPVSYIHIEAKEDFDFYRPISIQYLSDSTKTNEGWRYQYRNIDSDILSSLETNEFTFKERLAKKLRIIIRNQDNPALTIEAVKVKGYQHQLIARFDQSANYYLAYGREKARFPRYDIGQFEHKIPKSLGTLSLGDEQIIEQEVTPTTAPLFENKGWLWGLMLVIIVVLGWFTMKMLKES